MSIDSILKEWFWRIKQINDIDDQETVSFGNVSLAIERFQALAAFLQAYLPTLRIWMKEYLERNRVHIFIRYWATEIHNHALHTHLILTPHLQQGIKEWDSVFGKDPATCYDLADQVAKKTRKIWNISCCDDPTIMAIHEGKEHHSSCEWFGCDHCEDQQRAWEHELMRRMTESSHPLLNHNKRTFLHHHFKSELDEIVVRQKWEPPRFTEPRNPFPDAKQGQTVIQRFRDLLPIFIKGWSLPYFSNEYSHEKNSYKQFMHLWNTLDGIMSIIQTDLLMIIDLE